MSSRLVLTLVLVALADVSAVGRGPAQSGSLRAQARSNDPNVNDVPSPAELEEQEEEGTEEQDVSMSQTAQQGDLIQSPLPPAAPVTSSSGAGQAEAFAAPSLPASPAENQAELRLSLAEQSSSTVTAAAPNLQHLPKFAPGTSISSAAAAATPFPITVPGMDRPLPSVQTAAKAVFPPIGLKNMSGSDKVVSSDGSSFNALHPPQEQRSADFEPANPDKYNNCNPPCIAGRGICNDNLCFCKSPYTGTTCQHKLNTLPRMSYPMVVAFSCVSVVFGVIFAQLLHAWIAGKLEARLTWLGDGIINKEVWCPPTGKNSAPRGHT